MNNKTTLLIVEDDKAIVHFISSILSVNEYRTLYAGTGREAISLIASYRPDVVLLDLGLPDIDGLDVLKTVRQWSEVPIIVVSARGREQEKVQALDLGHCGASGPHPHGAAPQHASGGYQHAHGPV